MGVDKTKTQIQTEIAKLQQQLKLIETQEQISELVYIPELKIYIEKNLHTEMDRINKIVIPNGFRLLELSELLFIYNNYQDKFNWGKDKFFDEITNQPIKDCNYPYWNAWLHRLVVDGGSGLVGVNRLLGYDVAVRGVRFVKLNKQHEKK